MLRCFTLLGMGPQCKSPPNERAAPSLHLDQAISSRSKDPSKPFPLSDGEGESTVVLGMLNASVLRSTKQSCMAGWMLRSDHPRNIKKERPEVTVSDTEVLVPNQAAIVYFKGMRRCSYLLAIPRLDLI